METAKYEKLYALMQVVCVVTLWSAALFETGVDFFRSIFGVTSSMLAALALIGLLGIEFLVRRNFTISYGQSDQVKKALLIVILIYLAMTFAGIAWSPVPEAAFQKALRMTWYFGLTFMSIIVLQKFKAGTALKIISAGGVLSLLMLLLFVFSAGNLARNWSANSISVFQDYNMFYLHLVVSVLLSLALLNKLLQRKMWLVHLGLIGSYGILTFMLLFSGSRRGIIFYAIPLLVIAAITFLQAKKLLVPLALLGGGVALGLYLLLPALHSSYNFTTVQRIMIAIQQQGIFGLFGSRVDRIDQAIAYINSCNPAQVIFGVGTRSYNVIFGAGNHPHNFFFNAFIEGGLIKAAVAVLMYLLFGIFGLISAGKKLLYERVLIISALSMFILTIAISGEDGLLMKMFWLLCLYFWFACDARGEAAG